MQGMDANALVSSGMTAYKAATLSDAEVKTLSDDACKQMDSENKEPALQVNYTKRLNKIAKALGNNINGTPVNYKVYTWHRTSTPGQWPTAASASIAA